MARNDTTSEIIDAILRILIAGTSISAALIAPNILQVLDKPVMYSLDKLDKRGQDREFRRILRYMKKKSLIDTIKDYDHGIVITKEGRQRLKEADLDNLVIPMPTQWDKKWRLVFFDIPEKHKLGRDILTKKLKELGFYHLQRSVLVHPYSCREEIAALSAAYEINRYVSYIETDHIDQQKQLIRKFSKLDL